ncbi:hypothetical protein Bhyg_07455 [Pseudolycoriella hygida]|uniref:G domain-containing protein n=1 Tax=Pseudolycoriella hygida TaxID=35572 RepID=A0A9Q0N4J8_9DIPT|nr:hypothetical protein Bhyg_07455 [Pseudolycoriella hygida]
MRKLMVADVIKFKMVEITRKSLGCSANIGDLYDASVDKFCDKLFFICDNVKIITTEQSVTSADFIYNDDNTFNNLIKYGVECDLATDRLDMEHGKLLFTKEDAVKSNASHVVVGIEWGSCNVLSIEEKVQNAGKLKEYLQSIASCIKNNEIIDPSIAAECNFQFESDMMSADCTVPETIDDVVNFIKNIPKDIDNKFNGRGKCVRFTLCPLPAFLESFGYLTSWTSCHVQPIEVKLMCLLGDVISKIADSQAKLHAIQNTANQNDFCVPEHVQKAIKTHRRMTDEKMGNIVNKLVEVRRRNDDSFELRVIEQTCQVSFSVLDQFFSDMEPIIDRIGFINHAKGQGALYIGNISSFEEARRRIRPKVEYYVLFYAPTVFNENTAENIRAFNKLLKGNSACLLADLDMQSDLAQKEGVPSGTRICHYVKDCYRDHNVCKTLKGDRSLNSIRCICDMKPIKSKPKERALIHLICPGSLNGGECGGNKQQWVCEICMSPVEYGFDDHFYCDCGKEAINTFEFRCIDVNHGNEFIPFDLDVLKTKLKEIKLVPTVNILVLGETGVGKSTWINAMANYLTFSTLQEAMEEDQLQSLVPTKFVLLDENCKERVVSIGSSKNEATTAGQACTQFPSAQLVTLENQRIRIIDTPGIGDPRGIEQDKINVDNILRFLSELDQVHGICLLLKPNNARLTTFFKFCVKEILAQLHKSSVHNLLFCFTNTRSTFYKPGDTYPALKELLTEINGSLKLKSKGRADEMVLSNETMFCLDNEAFRFLCARRNNIEFQPEDFQNFSLSWDKSTAETQRMLAYIKSRKPHQVSETMSINEVRNTILTLARPMAKISDNIATNIRVAEEQKKIH